MPRDISRIRQHVRSFALSILQKIGGTSLHKSTFFVYNFTMTLGVP